MISGNNKKQTPWFSVHKRNILTQQTDIGRRILVPTSVDRGVLRGQRSRTPTAVNLSFLDRSRYFFFPVASHLSSQGWGEPVPHPLLLRKSGGAGNRTKDLWVCSQELSQLDHRGGRYQAILSVIFKHHYLLLTCRQARIINIPDSKTNWTSPVVSEIPDHFCSSKDKIDDLYCSLPSYGAV
jgi:hypothetical protein